MLPDEVVMRKIYVIRGIKVTLDMDLAELYGVETKYLKRAVRRNMYRFPSDFMFELTSEELKNWRCNFGTSSRDKMGLRVPPFTFTEHGVLMLASVLNSERAVLVNIQIVRIFIRVRKMLQANNDILHKLKEFEKGLSDHDDKIRLIFEYLKQLEGTRIEEKKFHERKPIGFR
ncbi:MAG: ORF6N domain-containing protein [Bacteroidales bacterium]|nr:ORF6N domain-containing protein [Bacteroidales bacterium]